MASANKLWVMGGSDGELKDDIWSSSDGETWELIRSHAPWSPRKHHTALYYGGRLWVMGGVDKDGNVLKDVWSSATGEYWIPHITLGGFPGRYGHTTDIHAGKITITGGMCNDGSTLEHTITSYLGLFWQHAVAKGERPARYHHSALSFNNKLWLFGGDDGSALHNDIWVFRDGVLPSLTADAGDYQTVLVGSSVTLGGAADATDDSDLSYQWSLVEKPTGSQAVLLDAATPNPYFTPDLAGEYKIILTVTDHHFWSATDEVNISAVYMINGRWVYSGGIDPLSPGNPAYTFDVHTENLVKIDLMAESLNSALILLDENGTIITLDNDLSRSDSSIYRILAPGQYIVVPATLYKNAVGDFQLNLSGADIKKVDVPTYRSNGMTLTGWNSSSTTLSGTLTIQKATSEQDLLHYLLFWGDTKTTKLPGSSLITYTQKAGQNLVLSLTGIPKPDEAAYLLLYSGNDRGELALPISLRIGGDLFPIQAAAGKNHSCTIMSDRTVKCWGDGSEGQMGTGFYVDIAPVVDVKNLDTSVQIDAGSEFNCVLKEDGKVSCWGNGNDGRLGNGSKTDEVIPYEIAGLSQVKQVATGSFHACALDDSNEVWCWGVGYAGQLGDGNNDSSSVPKKVINLTNATKVSAGGFHTCALLADKTVSCWGSGCYGALGNNDFINYNQPVSVSGLTNAVDIGTGWNHSCAVRSNGSVQCWGDGLYGQLGNGQNNRSGVPVNVISISDAVNVEAGWGHSCARRQNGRIMCWGYGNYGQLGNGGTLNRTTPVSVSEITNATQLSVGNMHSCVIQSDGLMKCWGYGGSGQLGVSGISSLSVPKAVPGL